MTRLEQIGEMAVKWAQASAEHKQRKIESKRAAVIALRLGAEFNPGNDAVPNWIVRTPEQEAAALRAVAAHDIYKKASRKAGALRASLTRMVRASVEPDVDIAAAWEELVKRERANAA